MTWDPERYARFSAPRLRPAMELLSRVGVAEPRAVADLGCGGGEITRLLADRYPRARVVGLDSSEAMLSRARETTSEIEWLCVDIAGWAPAESFDILYSNAALHWLPDHESLLPRLASLLAPGGELAVQMPLSRPQASHRLISEVLAAGGPGGRALGTPELRAEMARPWVMDPGGYLDLLAPSCDSVDLWTTEYHHVLSGKDPVLEWVRGTGLRPVEQGLEPDDWGHFLPRYREALEAAYPRRADGTTVYPFRRLFFVARRAATG